MIFDPQERRNHRSARVGMALFRMSQAIKKVTQAESDALGFSPAQIQALLFCYYTRHDVATVNNFAASIGTTHVTAVKMIDGLVGKGLIRKTKHPDDRRITLLSLTAEGRDIIPHLENWGDSLEEMLQPMSDEEMANVELGLGAIISSMEKQGHLVVSEPCRGCMHFRPNTGDADEPHYCALIQKYLSHESSLQACPEHTPS